jgi:hypothetical protein
VLRRVALFVALAALAGASASDAHDQGPAVARAIEGLRAGPVTYEADSGLTELEADALGRQLATAKDVYVALLAPASLRSGIEATAEDIGHHLGRPGTYVVSSGRQLDGWSSELSRDRLDELLAQARATQPRAIALRELGTAVAAEPTSEDDRTKWTLVGVGAVGLFGALLVLALRQRRSVSSTP